MLGQRGAGCEEAGLGFLSFEFGCCDAALWLGSQICWGCHKPGGRSEKLQWDLKGQPGEHTAHLDTAHLVRLTLVVVSSCSVLQAGLVVGASWLAGKV